MQASSNNSGLGLLEPVSVAAPISTYLPRRIAARRKYRAANGYDAGLLGPGRALAPEAGLDRGQSASDALSFAPFASLWLCFAVHSGCDLVVIWSSGPIGKDSKCVMKQ